jgi:hypothetical protein
MHVIIVHALLDFQPMPSPAMAPKMLVGILNAITNEEVLSPLPATTLEMPGWHSLAPLLRLS